MHSVKYSMTFLLSSAMLLSCLFMSAADNQPAMPTRLAALDYSKGNGSRRLTVWKVSISRDPIEALKKNTTVTSTSNTALVLVDSDEKKTKEGKVIGVFYEKDNTTTYPLSLWAAAIHLEKNEISVVISKARSHYVQLKIIQADLERSIGEWPIQFEPLKTNEWPASTPPIAETKQSIIDHHGCSVSAVKLSIEGERILVQAAREHKDCPSVQFMFNLKEKIWTVESQDIGTKVEPYFGPL